MRTSACCAVQTVNAFDALYAELTLIFTVRTGDQSTTPGRGTNARPANVPDSDPLLCSLNVKDDK